MVQISFSEPDHIEKIKTGIKTQTTRPKRTRPIKEGVLLQLYYNGRQVKSCKNCINTDCEHFGDRTRNSLKCPDHNKFFGVFKCENVSEIKFSEMSKEFCEKWAIDDGFDSWESAEKWFSKMYKKKLADWKEENWIVIKWKFEK